MRQSNPTIHLDDDDQIEVTYLPSTDVYVIELYSIGHRSQRIEIHCDRGRLERLVAAASANLAAHERPEAKHIDRTCPNRNCLSALKIGFGLWECPVCRWTGDLSFLWDSQHQSCDHLGGDCVFERAKSARSRPVAAEATTLASSFGQGSWGHDNDEE